MEAQPAGAAAGAAGDGLCGGQRRAHQRDYRPLDRFLLTWWAANRMELRLAEWCDELTRSGELFVVLYTNPADGASSAANGSGVMLSVGRCSSSQGKACSGLSGSGRQSSMRMTPPGVLPSCWR